MAFVDKKSDSVGKRAVNTRNRQKKRILAVSKNCSTFAAVCETHNMKMHV